MLVLPIISSIEFSVKTEFGQGETLIAKVSGNFLEPILKDNIIFYRGHVAIPMVFDSTKVQDDYYIYAVLPQKNANYSLLIKDVKYLRGSETIEGDLTKNFTITDKIADFNVNPGFVVTKGDFFLTLQNMQDKQISVNIKTSSSQTSEESTGFFQALFGSSSGLETNETSLTLKSGELKKINFKTNDFNKTAFKTIELSSENSKYEIPVYVIINQSVSIEEGRFKFSPVGLDFSMSTDSNITKIINIQNTGKKELNNISLELSDSLKSYFLLSRNEVDKLEGESSKKVGILVSSLQDEKTLQGEITAKIGDETFYLPITAKFLKDYLPLPGENESSGDFLFKTCLELNGKICKQNETCTGEKIEANSPNCCNGECKEQGSGSYTQIIGWCLLVLVVIAAYWFYSKKYKGVKSIVDLSKIGEKK